MADPVTSGTSPVTSGKEIIYTATKVTGPNPVTPPKYTTEIIKYDTADGSNPRTIATTDENGKMEFTNNASDEDKKSADNIRKASRDQVTSIADDVTTDASQKEALNKASGNNNKAAEGDDATNDEKVSKGEDFGKLESTKGTREDGFGFYVFPTSIRSGENGQDFLKFDMMKYEPKEIVGAMEKGSLGLSDRKKDRTSIGTVILPIPGGIQDQQQVSWGQDTMDAAAIALSDIALSAITEGLGAGVDAAVNTAKNISKSDDAKKALATAIAGSASGAGNLLTRTTGAIMNPNMELLFNSPSLRSFNFSFTLAPRNKAEAMTVIKIIRFFKQGMAPIRSKSRLFLRSPHTFRLAYKHKVGLTNDKDDHPFLNKFKECALNGFGVNYTPSGQYSTYEDGVMTSYQMTMGFQELEPVYNDDYGNDSFPNEIGF